MNIFSRFTLRTLQKNKMRTLVTIIGIALSVAMFTSVTSIIVSFQQYLMNMEIVREGTWEGRMIATNEQCIQDISKDKRVKGMTVMENLGFARLDDIQNEDKPYLMVEAIDDSFTDYSPINLIKGRMPKNSSEIVLSKHLEYNGGVKFDVGDTLKLQMGTRYYAEKKGDKPLPVEMEPFQAGETLKEKSEKTYTVVGICDRPVSEDYSAAGYSAFTQKGEENARSYDSFLTFTQPKKSYDILEKYTKKGAYTTHQDLLRFMGNSTNDRYNRVLYSMGAILIGIIMIGAISLIYSAFSISLSERTKQMGLLKSIGATKKQIRHSVIFEACVLCAAGIPLGLAAGLGGIGITLHAISGLMGKLWSAGEKTKLYLVVTWQAVLIAVIVSFITVLISAMIPASKAVRIPAIQAIRQSDEIKLRGEKVRTSRLTYKLFGFSGMLAGKNFKRNRKKYRTTVFSLFISIVLFVSATSFSAYMKVSTSGLGREEDYDISCEVTEPKDGSKTVSEIEKEIEQIGSVDSAIYRKEGCGEVEVPEEQISKEYLDYLEETDPERINESKKTVVLAVQLELLQEEAYQTYLKEKKIDVSKYMDTKSWNALVWDGFSVYCGKKIKTMNILKAGETDAQLLIPKEMKGYYYSMHEGSDYVYLSDKDNGEKRVSAAEAVKKHPIHLGKRMTAAPPEGVANSQWNEAVTIVLPYRAADDKVFDNMANPMPYTSFALMAEQHEKACTELSDYFENQLKDSSASGSIMDLAANRDSNQALILIIDVFSYGFIILISLISVANVFNTISTNILLRRQEFAMLKSVGMTQKGFRRMMNYECMLYGFKGLLYGLPVAGGLSYLMYKSVAGGLEVKYIFPWQGMAISVVSVFIVVFTTMIYAMSKIRKDNTMEALRNENL